MHAAGSAAELRDFWVAYLLQLQKLQKERCQILPLSTVHLLECVLAHLGDGRRLALPNVQNLWLARAMPSPGKLRSSLAAQPCGRCLNVAPRGEGRSFNRAKWASPDLSNVPAQGSPTDVVLSDARTTKEPSRFASARTSSPGADVAATTDSRISSRGEVRSHQCATHVPDTQRPASWQHFS